jgi:predicted AlkP superfamily pyrophosphatase or phosphodiesterase
VSLLHRLDYVERKDLWQPAALEGCPSILDTLSARSVPYFTTGWRGTDETRIEICLKALSGNPVQCCFIYLSELDAALHEFGLESKQARDAVVAASVRIRRVLARARELYSEVELFVFSDHGMTSVSEAHDLQSILGTLGPKRARYMAFFDSTMARFWTKDGETRQELEEMLSSLSFGEVLSENELRELGLRFESNEHGELVFVMNPGHIVAPSFVSNAVPKAMHGFHPSDPFSRACFLSCKEPACYPEHISDMYAFFETQLGLARD